VLIPGRFVVTARVNNSEPAILRSYHNPKMSDLLYEECKVWEACRATSAATTFFDPITIGKYGQTFIDGGILYNNPIPQVYREAEHIWPGREKLVLTIGTGCAPGKQFKGNLKTIVERMKDIVTQTERTANDFYQDHDDLVSNDLLWRFNVAHGLADIGLEEYKEKSAMADATQTYLDNGEIAKKMAVCINRFIASIPQGTNSSTIDTISI
jgi:predicted acylesterase/phospholipase RssA